MECKTIRLCDREHTHSVCYCCLCCCGCHLIQWYIHMSDLRTHNITYFQKKCNIYSEIAMVKVIWCGWLLFSYFCFDRQVWRHLNDILCFFRHLFQRTQKKQQSNTQNTNARGRAPCDVCSKYMMIWFWISVPWLKPYMNIWTTLPAFAILVLRNVWCCHINSWYYTKFKQKTMITKI